MEHPKLILHVDVTESILLANPDTGYGVRDTLNFAIAKIALVKKNEQRTEARHSQALLDTAEYCWHDGTPLSLSLRKRQDMETPPPLFRRVLKVSTSATSLTSVSFIGIIPKGARSYFDVFGEKMSRHFTEEGPGKIYLKLAMDILEAVTWPPDFPLVPGLVAEEEHTLYHLVMPSFFNLLVRLKMEKKAFMLCLRTSGGALACVAKALDLFATGEHPLFRESVKYIETGNIRCSHRLHYLAQQRIDGETKAESVRITSSIRKGLFHMESQIERFLLEFDASLGLTDVEIFDRTTSAGSHRVDRLTSAADRRISAVSRTTSGERKSSVADITTSAADKTTSVADKTTSAVSNEDKTDTAQSKDDKGPLIPRKVIWFTRNQSTVQPILIDGSTLSSEHGRGVCVRVRGTDKDRYRSLSDDEAAMMSNTLVFRPDLIQAAMNSDHYIQGVAECVNNLARIRHNQLMVDMCQTPLFAVTSAGKDAADAGTAQLGPLTVKKELPATEPS